MKKNKCILVLGTHKSGARMLTSCLQHLSLNRSASEQAKTGSADAVRSAQRDIALAHDILFRDLGFRWDMVGSLPKGWLESEGTRNAADTLSSIIKNRLLSSNGSFAVHDPSMCRLMPLWTKILERLDISPSLILMVRRPMEVAGLLKQEHGTELLKAHLLWMAYNREALSACRDMDHLLLTHEQFLKDPVSSLKGLQSLSGLSGTNPGNHAKDILELTAADPRLDQTAQGANDVANMFGHFDQIYEFIKQMEPGKHDPELKSDQNRSGKKTRSNRGLAAAVSAPGILTDAQEHSPAAQILNSLQEMIGSYERAELDLKLREKRLLVNADSASEILYARIYFPESDTGGYSEQYSRKILLAPGEWQQISLDIPRPADLRQHRMRLDPLNTRGMVSVSGIKLVNVATEEQVWSAAEDFSDILAEKDALTMSRNQSLQIAATGNDSRVFLPRMPDLPDSPMRLEFWIKAQISQSRLQKHFQDFQKQLQNKDNSLKELQDQIQSKDNSLEELQEQIQSKDLSLEEFQEQLENQKDLTREYFQALAESDEEQEKLRSRIHVIEQQNKQLRHGIQHLHRDFNKLLASRRWKVGNALGGMTAKVLRRSDRKTAADRMMETLDKLDRPDKKLGTSVQKTRGPAETRVFDGRRMIKDTDRLRKDFQALLRSRRWKMGSALGKATGAVLFRSGKATAADRIQKIFTEFEEWRQDIELRFLGSKDILKLQRWINRLDRDFHSLLRSRRWKMGNKLGNAAGYIFRRPGKPGAADRMDKILEKYR